MAKEKVVKTITEETENGTITHELTKKELALIDAYFMVGMNQTRAYLKLHPTSKYDTAKTQASKLFTKPNIKAAIDEKFKQNTMEAGEVLSRLADMARGSLEPFTKIDSDGFIYFDFSGAEALGKLHTIKKIETKRERRIQGKGEDAEEWEGESVKVELHDSQAALRDLGRVHKLFTDKTEINGDIEIVEKRVGIDLDKI